MIKRRGTREAGAEVQGRGHAERNQGIGTLLFLKFCGEWLSFRGLPALSQYGHDPQARHSAKMAEVPGDER